MEENKKAKLRAYCFIEQENLLNFNMLFSLDFQGYSQS